METEVAFAEKCEEYAEVQGLRDLMQSLMRVLLEQQPEDPLQCLIDHLKQQQQAREDEQPNQHEERNQQNDTQQNKGNQKGIPLRLVMLGLPGSGRREVSRRLAEAWSLPLISAGDLLRQNKEKYPNDEAARAIASKTLASDELVIDLVSKRMQALSMKHGDCKGWILDGFPRTRAQAVAFLQLRLSPDRCCLLLPPDDRAKATVRAVAASAVVSQAVSADARNTSGPHFCNTCTPETARHARLQLMRETDIRLQVAYRHTNSVLNVLGPLAETVPAEDNLASVVDILKAAEDAECRKALLKFESGVDFQFDSLLGQTVADRLGAADCARRGWVLEGFPITAEQTKLLRHHRIVPNAIVCLMAPTETLVERVARRSVDPTATAEVSFRPSNNSGRYLEELRKDAARLVELSTAQLERWLPDIRKAFPRALTTICADDAISMESVGERVLEFLSRRRMPPIKSF